MYLSYVIDKQIKLFLNNKLFENDTPEENANKENRTYKKLPCIGNISVKIKKKTGVLCKRFCKITDNNTVLTPFRLPNALRSFVVYKFLCARFQSCYIGETRRHLSTRIKEYLLTDKKSHKMKHLLENKTCKNLCDKGCFLVTDYASSPFSLKIKESL